MTFEQLDETEIACGDRRQRTPPRERSTAPRQGQTVISGIDHLLQHFAECAGVCRVEARAIEERVEGSEWIFYRVLMIGRDRIIVICGATGTPLCLVIGCTNTDIKHLASLDRVEWAARPLGNRSACPCSSKRRAVPCNSRAQRDSSEARIMARRARGAFWRPADERRAKEIRAR